MYRYLMVSKSAREMVSFPDGTTQTVDLGQGQAVAAAWTGEAEMRRPRPTPVTAASLQAHQDAVAAWQAELDRLQDAVGSPSITLLRDVRERYEREHPRPTPPGSMPEGEVLVTPTVARVPWWQAVGPGDDESCPLAPGDAPLPRQALADRLTDLEAAGWEVVHVSEDRVVEHDEAWARSTIVGTSVLLRRSESR